jgi:xylulokinase
MLTLGFDIGSSFVKASLIDVDTGLVAAQASYPDREMTILAPAAGWAEQDPETWWEAVKQCAKRLRSLSNVPLKEVGAIGISYQMHGLVLVDKKGMSLRPSIIWCDSRATEIGRKAFQAIGEKVCLEQFLNSPGNFTASKLRWVKENEPALFNRIHKMLLPGDYIAFRLTGDLTTTASGLSEGILWNFRRNDIAAELLKYYDLSSDLIPAIVPTIGTQGVVTKSVAKELGLRPGIPVTYRAGDQPNNALSLNVLEPGEIAATAGTSGVVYAVSDKLECDPLSRVNAFAHINHSNQQTRVGILLCINGAGITNSWVRKISGDTGISYETMNKQAASVSIGSDGLVAIPFGNGAERMLGNKAPGAHFDNIHFTIHSKAHLYRAVQEGVAFAFHYGMDVMREMGIRPRVIRAGAANMFLSAVFRATLASTAKVAIELYNTDGAQGAARATAVGAGMVPSMAEAFKGLERIRVVEPEKNSAGYDDAYAHWLQYLTKHLSS